ncbi:SET domain-containing protein 5 isoform X2 [Eurytemora carolleeae]|uniref:SET domain-containing protein 5 isoform X2 n=1 Tax=Eurytemora carolleeae TaxID=1294199 RepID=UPI000C75BE4B|nr:SET domain-containing protein 5 isoform X2 [Eurytemora carolleeae]|eukprot:XP_023330710.1 SET domain-containing protein 5-like isoform X2 [Eurytemora affinis]
MYQGKAKEFLQELSRENLKIGELIFQDFPLFIVPSAVHTDSSEQLDDYLEAQLQDLCLEAKEAFWDLTDSKSQGPKSSRGIYFTNCFSIKQTTTVEYPTAMLPILARLNHSCRPNTEFHWNDELGCDELRAFRNISQGEELTNCYLDLTIKGRITQQERRSLLKSGYGFDCNCEVCSLPFNLLEQDDKLRVEAFNLSQTCFDLKDSLSSEEISNVLRTAERWFFLRKMLGYKVIHQLEAAEVVWHLAMLLGQEQTALNISREGEVLAGIRYGKESIEVENWKEKRLNPVKSLIG